MCLDPASARTDETVTDDVRWLRRLRWVGVALPVLSIIALQLTRPFLIGTLGTGTADQLVAVLSIGGALWFGVVMFGYIERGHRLVLQREDMLLRVRHQADVEHERHQALLAERERIAREMHDSLAQVLAATHLRLRAASTTTAAPAALRAELTDLADTCDEAYRDVRETIFGLREAARTDRGMVEVVDDYVSRFSRTSGVTTEVRVPPELAVELAPDAQVHVVRIIQEALTNVRKHSGARTATVTIAEVPECRAARVTVRDDGHGFDTRDHGCGSYGLRSMRERASLIGAELCVTSAPEEGTTVQLTVPCARRDHQLVTATGPTSPSPTADPLPGGPAVASATEPGGSR